MCQILCLHSAQLCSAVRDISCEEIMVLLEIAVKLGQCEIKTNEINA